MTKTLARTDSWDKLGINLGLPYFLLYHNYAAYCCMEFENPYPSTCNNTPVKWLCTLRENCTYPFSYITT